jgi:hypothetical protein
MFPRGLASKLGISLIPVPAVQSNSNKLRRDSLLSDLCLERLTPKYFDNTIMLAKDVLPTISLCKTRSVMVENERQGLQDEMGRVAAVGGQRVTG